MKTSAAVRKHLFSFLIIFLLSATALAGCGADSGKNNATDNEKEEGKNTDEAIRIGYVTILSNAPAVIAEKQGLINKQGLKTEFYPFSNGPDLYKALSSGKLDIAYAGVPAGVNWASRGAEIKGIAKVSDGSFGLMVKPEAGIETVADLKGKKMGSIVKGSGADVLLRGLILPEANLAETDVTILQMKMPVMEQAVSKGSIVAAVAGEPFLTMAELRGLEVVKEIPDPALVVLATELFLKEQPEAVKKFIEGHKESIDFIEKNKEEASKVLAKAYNVPSITDQTGKVWEPAEVLAKALDRHNFNYKITEDDFKFYQQVADMNYQLKMIEKPFEVNTLFDTSWIQ